MRSMMIQQYTGHHTSTAGYQRTNSCEPSRYDPVFLIEPLVWSSELFAPVGRSRRRFDTAEFTQHDILAGALLSPAAKLPSLRPRAWL